MVENILGKGENVGLPAFSPFPKMFSKTLTFLRGLLKVGTVWVKGLKLVLNKIPNLELIKDHL